MRTKEILATVAITGAVATFALLNSNSITSNKSFLATPFTAAEREFINFIAKYHRSYGTKEEYAFRLEQFTKAYNQIIEHNSEPSSYRLGVNHLADLTEYEYKQMLGFKADMKKATSYTTLSATNAPDSVDWREQGAVSAVQNQGSCGSCWSFSATAAMESAWFIARGTLTKLSEQQLVDCSFMKPYGNFACGGGLMDAAFEYAMDYQMVTEDSYPYKAARGTCDSATVSSKGQFDKLSGFVDVTISSPSALVAAIAQQPVSVAIEADKGVFQLYSGGVLTDNGKLGPCGTELDHGVVAVGYGHDSASGLDYYIVRNSWGPTWGESGYVRIQRTSEEGKPGVCGIQLSPSYPVAK